MVAKQARLSKANYDVVAALHGQGRMRDVVVRGTRLARKHPESAPLLNLLGSAHARLGDPSKAIRFFRRATRLDPRHVFALRNLGMALMLQGDLEGAEENLRASLTLSPTEVGLAVDLSKVLLLRGDRDAALAVLSTMNDRLSTNPGDQLALGKALFSHMKYDEASRAFAAGAHFSPDHYDLNLALGETLSRCGRFEDALAPYQRAARVRGDDPQLFVSLGRLWMHRGDLAKAKAAFARAISLDGDFLPAYSERAHLKAESGDLGGAISDYRRCLELDPDNAQAAHLLAAYSGETTDAAPEKYVAGLFDSYAESFDQSLVGTLQYRVPTRLAQVLTHHIGPGQKMATGLDLGCGTGLSGVALTEIVTVLDGIDLSQAMLEMARKKSVYRSLQHHEIVAAITQNPGAYDLYVSADVLVYVGDLAPVFAALRACAKSGALYLFSTEHQNDAGFALRTTGRYAHSRAYVEATASTHGLEVIVAETDDLRIEFGEMLTGGLYLLRVP